MLRPPPRSTRTDTPVPYPTLFRSATAIRSQLSRPVLRLSPSPKGLPLPLLLTKNANFTGCNFIPRRSEEHTSELQSLMRISYAVFCLKKKINYCHVVCLTKNNTRKTDNKITDSEI